MFLFFFCVLCQLSSCGLISLTGYLCVYSIAVILGSGCSYPFWSRLRHFLFLGPDSLWLCPIVSLFVTRTHFCLQWLFEHREDACQGKGGLVFTFKFGPAHLKSPAADLLTSLPIAHLPTHNFSWWGNHCDFGRLPISAVLLRSGGNLPCHASGSHPGSSSLVQTTSLFSNFYILLSYLSQAVLWLLHLMPLLIRWLCARLITTTFTCQEITSLA